jgi:hypothetical protein
MALAEIVTHACINHQAQKPGTPNICIEDLVSWRHGIVNCQPCHNHSHYLESWLNDSCSFDFWQIAQRANTNCRAPRIPSFSRLCRWMARVYAHRRSFVRCHYFAFLKRSGVLDIMSFLSYLNGKSARNDL